MGFPHALAACITGVYTDQRGRAKIVPTFCSLLGRTRQQDDKREAVDLQGRGGGVGGVAASRHGMIGLLLISVNMTQADLDLVGSKHT